MSTLKKHKKKGKQRNINKEEFQEELLNICISYVNEGKQSNSLESLQENVDYLRRIWINYDSCDEAE